MSISQDLSTLWSPFGWSSALYSWPPKASQKPWRGIEAVSRSVGSLCAMQKYFLK